MSSHISFKFNTSGLLLVISIVALFQDVYGQRELGNTYSLTVRMPHAVSTKSDDLLCHSQRLSGDEEYILEFTPHATKKVAHHMMVYGCNIPGSNQPYWSCGEMDDHSNKSVCGDGERQIIWAWAMDADGRKFPEDVGFRVGKISNINYIVIQLHYADKFEAGQTDSSGVTLRMTNRRQTYQAGYYVLYTYGSIPPRTKEFHMEAACEFNNSYSIIPLAYRTHSHNLGVVTSAYRVRDGKWTEIGRMSPQLPQSFYDVTNEGTEVKNGDIIAARCTMSSDRDFFTKIGPQHVDEMCNFYVMYYTSYKGPLHIEYCMRDAGSFHWSDYLTTPPDTASSIDGIPPFTRVDPYATKTEQGMK